MPIENILDMKPVIAEGEKIYELLKTQYFGLAYAEIKDSRLHWHEHTTEWYFVVGGEGEIILNDEHLRVSRNDFVMIRPQAKHRARMIGRRPLAVYIISSPPWSKDDHYPAN